jgi:hypothetical protein
MRADPGFNRQQATWGRPQIAFNPPGVARGRRLPIFDRKDIKSYLKGVLIPLGSGNDQSIIHSTTNFKNRDILISKLNSLREIEKIPYEITVPN